MAELLGCHCAVSLFFYNGFYFGVAFQLSENVIDRMKETSPSGPKSQRYSGAYGASGTLEF